MLIENTLFGSSDKVKIAIERFKQFEPPEGYYLAFSGGKDSVVLYHLALLSGVKFDAHYNNTTVDPPELVRFVRESYPNVIEHRPKKSMFQLIPTRGLPSRISRWCCEEFKEIGSKGRVVLTGIRWAESHSRKKRNMVEQCYRYQSKSFVHPIIDWANKDIWNYIHQNNIGYCSLYDEGFNRLGCIMCPMAGRMREMERQRYPNFEKAYRIACQKLYESRKSNGSKSVDRWKDGNEMFDWWISNTRKSEHKEQFNIFD